MIYSESELYCKPGIIACAAVSFIFNLLCFIYASPGASVISHVYAFIQNKNHDVTFFICSLKLSKTVRFKPWLTNETEDGFKMLFFFYLQLQIETEHKFNIQKKKVDLCNPH